jgi:hypothetical protein
LRENASVDRERLPAILRVADALGPWIISE